jgi:hypothetical protein
VYGSAVLKGIVAVPVTIAMKFLSVRADIMAGFTLSLRLRLPGWGATLAIAITIVAMAMTWFG